MSALVCLLIGVINLPSRRKPRVMGAQREAAEVEPPSLYVCYFPWATLCQQVGPPRGV